MLRVTGLASEREQRPAQLSPLPRIAFDRVEGGEPRQCRRTVRSISRGAGQRSRTLEGRPGLGVAVAAHGCERITEEDLERTLTGVTLLPFGQVGEQRDAPPEVADRLLVRRARRCLLAGPLVLGHSLLDEARRLGVPR